MLFFQSLPEANGFRVHTSHLLPEQGEVSIFKLCLGKPAAQLSPEQLATALGDGAWCQRSAELRSELAAGWGAAGMGRHRTLLGCLSCPWLHPGAPWGGSPYWRVLGC